MSSGCGIFLIDNWASYALYNNRAICLADVGLSHIVLYYIIQQKCLAGVAPFYIGNYVPHFLIEILYLEVHKNCLAGVVPGGVPAEIGMSKKESFRDFWHIPIDYKTPRKGHIKYPIWGVQGIASMVLRPSP